MHADESEVKEKVLDIYNKVSTIAGFFHSQTF